MRLFDKLRNLGPKPWDEPDERWGCSEEVRNAVRAVKDEKRLFEIAMNSKSDGARAEAAGNIKDESMLLQLSQSWFGNVRIACVRNKNFRDAERLAEMALNDRSSYIRKYALEKIDDEMVLAKAIAREPAKPEYDDTGGFNPPEPSGLIPEAFERITREEAYFYIARYRKDSGLYTLSYRNRGTDEWESVVVGLDVVTAAVEKINDQNLLKHLAVEAVFDGARAAALAKIDDAEFVKDIERYRAQYAAATKCKANAEKTPAPKKVIARRSSKKVRKERSQTDTEKTGLKPDSVQEPIPDSTAQANSVQELVPGCPAQPSYTGKRKGVAIALWFIGFFGYLNLHNFHLGRMHMGLYRLTAYIAATALFINFPDQYSPAYRVASFVVVFLLIWNFIDLFRLIKAPANTGC